MPMVLAILAQRRPLGNRAAHVDVATRPGRAGVGRAQRREAAAHSRCELELTRAAKPEAAGPAVCRELPPPA